LRLRVSALLASLALTLAIGDASAFAAVPTEKPQTYLASVSIPLGSGERTDKFSFKTWGVTFLAVCHIPGGWRITAGGDATPEGALEGEANQGTTWLDHSRMRELNNFVLLMLWGPIQHGDKRIPGGVLPATFKGSARLDTGDAERSVSLSDRNIRLTPATHCPRGP
jgi:hypothetical protein